MPQNKDRKRLVRARMAETGENYTRALTALELRGAMADQIAAPPDLGKELPEAVVAALRTVPRHLFMPGVPLARAYHVQAPRRDGAVLAPADLTRRHTASFPGCRRSWFHDPAVCLPAPGRHGSGPDQADGPRAADGVVLLPCPRNLLRTPARQTS